MGLARAGFEVHGLDIEPQPNYPFQFTQGDAFLAALEGYDLLWASVPCQGHTAYRRRPNHVRPVDTDGAIARARCKLKASGIPYIIENVPRAPLIDPIVLCGSMFGLDVRRHRIFECSFAIDQLHCRHELQQGSFPQATNRTNRRKTVEVGVWRIALDVQRRAMGIDWMTVKELSQAIPPAYAEYLGVSFLRRRTA